VKRIISNESWFLQLVYIRLIVLPLLLGTVLFSFFAAERGAGFGPFWESLLISLLVTIAIWQQLQRPAYLELLTHADALVLRLYIPDSRYLFVLRREHIRSIIIHPEDELRVHGQFSRWPWQRKIQFTIIRADGSRWCSPLIDISWVSRQEWAQLQALPKLRYSNRS